MATSTVKNGGEHRGTEERTGRAQSGPFPLPHDCPDYPNNANYYTLEDLVRLEPTRVTDWHTARRRSVTTSTAN